MSPILQVYSTSTNEGEGTSKIWDLTDSKLRRPVIRVEPTIGGEEWIIGITREGKSINSWELTIEERGPIKISGLGTGHL